MVNRIARIPNITEANEIAANILELKVPINKKKKL